MVKLNQEQAATVGQVLERLSENDYIDPHRITIENREYPPAVQETVIVSWREYGGEPPQAKRLDLATDWYTHTAFIDSAGVVRKLRKPVVEEA